MVPRYKRCSATFIRRTNQIFQTKTNSCQTFPSNQVRFQPLSARINPSLPNMPGKFIHNLDGNPDFTIILSETMNRLNGSGNISLTIRKNGNRTDFLDNDVKTRQCLVSNDPHQSIDLIQQSQNSNNSLKNNPNQPPQIPG